MSDSGRNPDGTFKKGNKIGKKDFTKELAQHVTSQELYWTSEMMARPIKELKELQKSGKLDDESLITYSILKSAIAGNFKPTQFLIEMILGRPKQQVESNNVNKNNNIQLNYKLDE